jgi:hypothetical protein
MTTDQEAIKLPKGPLYGLWGESTGQFLSQDGRPIFHTNREEMEFLFPGTPVKPIGINPLEGIPLQYVRGMEAVEFPLNRSEFRAQG